MKVEGRHYRTIWPADDGHGVEIIDQTRLPHAFVVARLATVDEAATPFARMRVRGAPLIGAAAAYGMALAASADPTDDGARCGACSCCSRRGRRRSICAGRSTTC